MLCIDIEDLLPRPLEMFVRINGYEKIRPVRYIDTKGQAHPLLVPGELEIIHPDGSVTLTTKEREEWKTLSTIMQ